MVATAGFNGRAVFLTFRETSKRKGAYRVAAVGGGRSASKAIGLRCSKRQRHHHPTYKANHDGVQHKKTSASEPVVECPGLESARLRLLTPGPLSRDLLGDVMDRVHRPVQLILVTMDLAPGSPLVRRRAIRLFHFVRPLVDLCGKIGHPVLLQTYSPSSGCRSVELFLGISRDWR